MNVHDAEFLDVAVDVEDAVAAVKISSGTDPASRDDGADGETDRRSGQR